MRIRVDPEKCQGHARCKSLAPKLFELDEFGKCLRRQRGIDHQDERPCRCALGCLAERPDKLVPVFVR